MNEPAKQPLDLPSATYEPQLSASIDLERGLSSEVLLHVFDLSGTHEVRTCYGDVVKIVNALRDYINCKETPEVSVPVPNQAALEELILAILAKNQSYLKKQPEPKPSTAQQDAAISAASEPMPPADGAELEQWFGIDPELSENVRAGLKAKDRNEAAPVRLNACDMLPP